MRNFAQWVVCLLVLSVLFAAGEIKHGSFWQLTDIHVDPWYEDRQESCNKHIDNPGVFGDYECDSPWTLAENSIKTMKKIRKDVDFILWSGDNPPHVKNGSNLKTTKSVFDIHKNLTEILRSVYPGTLVIPVLGNHDYSPTNQFPGDGSELYDLLADLWSDWLNTDDMQATFRRGGYYTLMLDEVKKIRGITMNNNLCLITNKKTAGQRDPGGQFAWMKKVLSGARANGEKVHIFTHIPPGKVPEVLEGSGWFVPEHNTRQVELFVEYSDIILGMYSAHAHHDIFKLFFKNDQPVASMLVSPSVTPLRYIVDAENDVGTARNPALRLIEVNTSTGQLEDVRQYSMDLRKANAKGKKPRWKFLYSYKEKYALQDMSAQELYNALEKMKLKENKGLFKQFHKLYTVNTKHPGNTECNCTCKSSFLCAVEFQIYSDFDDCFLLNRYCGQDSDGSGSSQSSSSSHTSGGDGDNMVETELTMCSPRGTLLGCQCNTLLGCMMSGGQMCPSAGQKCKKTGRICCCPEGKWAVSCTKGALW